MSVYVETWRHFTYVHYERWLASLLLGYIIIMSEKVTPPRIPYSALVVNA